MGLMDMISRIKGGGQPRDEDLNVEEEIARNLWVCCQPTLRAAARSFCAPRGAVQPPSLRSVLPCLPARLDLMPDVFFFTSIFAR